MTSMEVKRQTVGLSFIQSLAMLIRLILQKRFIDDDDCVM